ncbi:NADPH-dependent ferric siderophore reductase, contains FAD-binding and SIP domains [Micromonospora haikouensis]|uniref:NADPH-dependent ferric siderophore reductase, contains FAD-binding and SIP domains n=1 Tax=Micromonospora haikouensis TaxID=686309 RepID=A0A1C4XGA4_9ACTN|nr:siderophore-interacting protein [Micromonospora haikouensis]SCF07589.1 NADPH-dependent ferric siderophore reductase, contains FAD-binding and SIP domains [Micromonospora haikouensis]
MARTNMKQARLKPEAVEPLTIQVVRRERLSAHFVRITFSGGDIERFRYMGFDQWFRLFLPVADDSLERLPAKLDALSYLRFLTIPKASRPVLRNYTVRAYRPKGPEIDVDFVIHGSTDDGTAGPAATWADRCRVGDRVAILDEGIMFNPPGGTDRVLLVADETGLAATAGILASLAPHVQGQAVVEIPSDADRQELDAPAGVEVIWLAREDPQALPGRAALAAAQALPAPPPDAYAWTVGEQTLPTALRRHWIAAGIPKEHIMFCGYWKAPKSH